MIYLMCLMWHILQYGATWRSIQCCRGSYSQTFYYKMSQCFLSDVKDHWSPSKKTCNGGEPCSSSTLIILWLFCLFVSQDGGLEAFNRRQSLKNSKRVHKTLLCWSLIHEEKWESIWIMKDTPDSGGRMTANSPIMASDWSPICERGREPHSVTHLSTGNLRNLGRQTAR